MKWLSRPAGGDIETYRKYNSTEAKEERQQALTEAQALAQIHGSEQAEVLRTVRESDQD